MSWQYTVGLSVIEVNEESLKKTGFSYKKVVVGEAVQKAISECMGAEYKNPSSMRLDAPHAFSCSSLISYIFTKAGVWMPSLSVDKYVFGKAVEKNELQFGDLVFSNTGEGRIYYETVEYLPGTKVPEGVDHAGIYLGNGEVLHSSDSIGEVGLEKIDKAKNFKHIVGFRRVCDLNEERFVVNIPNDRSELMNREAFLKEIQKYESHS
ncbi:MAG TPA: NlpC/P60 family protein [Candidatus Paceibacterota bacterium]